VTTAVLLIGGDIPERDALHGIDEADLVVAVDSGVRIARQHGLAVHVLVGDLDSATEGDRAWAQAEGAEVIEFPADKDATDLELAIEHSIAAGAERIVAVGVEGGRLDHELANWLTLCRPHPALTEVRASSGIATILHGDHHHTVDLRGEPGNLVSLLALSGDAGGVVTTGLKWPLKGATIEVGSSLGVSNEMVDESASVSVATGTLLVIRPDPTARP